MWTLGDGRRVIAELVVDGADFPWLEASVIRLTGFQAVAPLFAAELALLEGLSDDDSTAWEDAYGHVAAATTLTKPDGTQVPEFLIHIDGDRAWWRWSDEPFDE